MDKKSKREFVDQLRTERDEKTQKFYPVRMILRTIDYSSATYYGNGGKDRTGKRGPKTSIDDEQLVKYIKETIEEIPFHGTGYKKIHKRLNRKKLEEGDSVSKKSCISHYAT